MPPDFLQKPFTLMGVVNVTPDSFSDGGQFTDVNRAINHALQLSEEGADIIDIGGESTRPGSEPVSIPEEIHRVIPVIEGIKNRVKCVSVDSCKPEVMQAAIEAGAGMINDVRALRENGSLEVAARSGVPVCLMHMRGSPQDMQKNPSYNNVVEDVFEFLKERVESCAAAGIDKSHIIIDPGIGFGKTPEHNLLLLGNIRHFRNLNVPVLLGASRKSFIQKISPDAAVEKRLPGSLAAVLHAYAQGVKIFRVHDVAKTRQALEVFSAIDAKGT